MLDRLGEEERWALRDAPAEVSFARDEAGTVAGLRLHQGGSTFDLPKGEPEPQPEVVLGLEDVEQYLGWFREEGSEREVEVVLHDGALALRIPETTEPLALRLPDESGAWRLRMNPAVEIDFAEEGGEVASYVARGPGGEATFTRIDGPGDDTDG